MAILWLVQMKTSLQTTRNNDPFFKNLKITPKYFATAFLNLTVRPFSTIIMTVSNSPPKTFSPKSIIAKNIRAKIRISYSCQSVQTSSKVVPVVFLPSLKSFCLRGKQNRIYFISEKVFISEKGSILDVWQSSQYVSDTRMVKQLQMASGTLLSYKSETTRPNKDNHVWKSKHTVDVCLPKFSIKSYY